MRLRACVRPNCLALDAFLAGFFVLLDTVLTLRAAGCQALDELRDLVGILRTEPAGDQTPSTPGLPVLIAESTAAGTPAELAEDGDRALASPVVGRTAYRIVCEALTNARKHAPGAFVLVQICYRESQVRVVVSNGPAARGADSELSGTGSGLGLAGLRQRIELMHGTLRARPTPDGEPRPGCSPTTPGS